MTLLAYLDSALLLALLMTTLSKQIKVFCNLQVVAVVVGVLLPLVMINDLPMYQYLRAVSGELSITTKLVLVLVLYQRATQKQLNNFKDWQWMLTGIAVTGVLFYPLALGITMFDPYAYGYSAGLMAVLVVVLAIVCFWQRYWLSALALSLSLAAYVSGIMESDNLWDYLFDPLLWMYALFVSCVTLWKKYLPAITRTGN